MYSIAADFPAQVISSSLRCSLFSKFNIIESSVYSAPPRPFICLLSPLSCGSVISGSCLWTKTVVDRTQSMGTRGEGSDALPELVVSKDYLVVFELCRLYTRCCVLTKEAETMFDWSWDLFLRGDFTVWMCTNELEWVKVNSFFYILCYQDCHLSTFTSHFQCFNVHINTNPVTRDGACYCGLPEWDINHVYGVSWIVQSLKIH